jgi:uncharacterized membrane protein
MRHWFGRRPALTQGVRKNITSIAELEDQLERQRSAVDHVSDAITGFVGSLRFLTAHVLGFALWVFWNAGLLPGVVPIDPYPFAFLNFVLAVEAVFLSTFVLMSQNRQNRRSDDWAHLALQVSLLAEQETTKILRMQQAVCEQLGLPKVARDPELKEMIETTHVETLAKELGQAREPDETRPGE